VIVDYTFVVATYGCIGRLNSGLWPCVPTELIDMAAEMLLNDCCMNDMLCSNLSNFTIIALKSPSTNWLVGIYDQDNQIQTLAIVAAYLPHQVRAE